MRAQLKDERLQELIRDIDTAPDPEKVRTFATCMYVPVTLMPGDGSIHAEPVIWLMCMGLAPQALKLALQQHPDFVGFAERVLAIVSPQETAPQPPNPTVAAIRNLLAQQA